MMNDDVLLSDEGVEEVKVPDQTFRIGDIAGTTFLNEEEVGQFMSGWGSEDDDGEEWKRR